MTGNKKLLLIIEDNPILTGLYKTTFEKAGFEVVFAHDGKTGLNLLKETRPSGIVLDLLMPGMDGFSVLEEMKNNPSVHGTAKTVVLTSIEDEKELARAKELGALDCLVKSQMSLANIVERVTTLLG